MAAGADLYELFGPLSDEKLRRVIQILGLGPGQRARQKSQAPVDTKAAKAA